MMPLLLNEALNDKLRRKHGLNIVFTNKEKRPLLKGWNEFIEKPQTDQDLKKSFRSGSSAYGYVCGWNDLICIDFDNPLPYFLCQKEFGDRFDTFTVETPNRGFHVYFFSSESNQKKNINTYKDNLHVEIILRGNSLCHGRIETRRGLEEYIIKVDKDIRRDNTIIMDVLSFLEETIAKLEFLEYECVKAALRGKPELSHEARLIFANFLVRELKPSIARYFFRNQSDYNKKTTVYQLRSTLSKIEKGELNPPTCKTMRSVFNVDASICENCIRHEQDKAIPEKKEKLRTISVDDLLENVGLARPKIQTGQHWDEAEKKLYYSWYDPKKDAFLVLGEDGLGVGIHDDDIKDWKKMPENVHRMEGAKIKPPKRVEDVVLGCLVKWAHEGFPAGKKLTLSNLYDRIYQALKKYIYFRYETEYSLVSAWIIGTYMRQAFIWYPYLVFFGLRNVGKSTAITVLSRLCFQGAGDSTGDRSEAVIFRKASGLKGLMTVDHFEEIINNPVKNITYHQFLENAWYRDNTVERMNDNFDVDSFTASVSVAVSTREENDVLGEKGIVVIMEEAPRNSSYADNYRKILSDPEFDEITRLAHLVALKYAKDVHNTYINLSQGDGWKIQGRDWNKISPLLSIVAVIDQEKGEDSKLFEELYEYAEEYSRRRKDETSDIEDLALQYIIEEGYDRYTLKELQEHIKEEIDPYITPQKVGQIMKKLLITKRKSKRGGETIYYIDRKLATKKALERGIPLASDHIYTHETQETEETTKKTEDGATRPEDGEGTVEFTDIEEKALRIVYAEMDNPNQACGYQTLLSGLAAHDVILDEAQLAIERLKARGYLREEVIGHIHIPEEKIAKLIDMGVIKI